MSKTVEISTLRLTVWERPGQSEEVRWGASISNVETKKVLAKTYAESECAVVGKIGYDFYTKIFHGKTFDQVHAKIGNKQEAPQ
ncbi:MAG: hypothetical protein OXU62_08465 [Gammaproteobacteria bacterium]|nr:hypothetical protein [Gammaproteobacteria bacterium]